MRMTLAAQRWSRATPLAITGYTFDAVEIVLVTLEEGGVAGRGEAAGIYYRGETTALMIAQIEALRSRIERGIDRSELQALLHPGGARHALDAALWDLDAKRSGVSVFQMAGLDAVRPLRTTFTCGADAPAAVVAKARSFPSAQAIKLKLNGDGADGDRVIALREALPNVWLMVDANQGLTRKGFEKLLPIFDEMAVSLIEQPFPIGREDWLDGLDSPIPITADESVLSLGDVEKMVGRFSGINIKLDKCGGLTEGLAMAERARSLGLSLMVGSMGGTALGVAPAFILGQLCRVVDLDGPALLARDRAPSAEYNDGYLSIPTSVWGYPLRADD